MYYVRYFLFLFIGDLNYHNIFLHCKQVNECAPLADSKKENIFIMNLNNILQESGNITIAVSLTDLKQFAVEIIESTKRDLEEVVISDKAETYPSPKQVCEILDVDLSTLWRWNKRGYLCSSEVGGKRRYKMSEVKAILNGGRVK